MTSCAAATSCAREGLAPAQLAAEIAELVHSLELRRAPVIVGHGTSAHIAAAFAASYATHALVTADELDPCRITTADQFLAKVHRSSCRPSTAPMRYRTDWPEQASMRM